MHRSAPRLVLVDADIHTKAARLVRRARGRAPLTWDEVLAAASRWQAPDPLCPRRAEVVRALATRAVGWA
ncbi:MAG: hypothetical protein R3A52_31575 [Polyangiales bacterium]